MGKGKGGLRTEELGTEEIDAQHYAPCTLNCMYVFYCLLLWTVNTDLIWTVTLRFIATVWTFVNVDNCEWTLDKDKCNIFWQANKHFSFVFRYSKRTCCSSSDSRVYPTPLYYTGMLLYCKCKVAPFGPCPVWIPHPTQFAPHISTLDAYSYFMKSYTYLHHMYSYYIEAPFGPCTPLHLDPMFGLRTYYTYTIWTLDSYNDLQHLYSFYNID